MREFLCGIVLGGAVVTLFASVASACLPGKNCCHAQSACKEVVCGNSTAICNCCYCGPAAIPMYICADTSRLPTGCHDATLCGPSGS